MRDNMHSYKISTGRTIATDREPTPVQEWLDEGTALFGKDIHRWRFQCPMCGKVYSVQEFVAAGGDVNGAYQECIGRYHGAGSPGSQDGNPDGCNWAAYGLFGIPNGKGRLVKTPDEKITEVFDFAREDTP